MPKKFLSTLKTISKFIASEIEKTTKLFTELLKISLKTPLKTLFNIALLKKLQKPSKQQKRKEEPPEKMKELTNLSKKPGYDALQNN
ncbi:hypothetical protein AVEN_189257-1 [Araneus ventricosus]|uniref:Uncharacterized protein n=1 Tax=Araneus ventricosus TaxID=182803 RepID=A0A4Y2PS13_ARAVE|nr:hypothetical protein AVEN_189257-1 [Araneus ventricosus]